MTKEEAKKLESLFDKGYLILISSGIFLDGPVSGIYEEEEGDKAGKVCYCSDNYTDRPLDEVHTHEVEVYAPALDRWDAMADSMDQDRKDAWECTLDALQEEAKANAPKFYTLHRFGPFGSYHIRVNGKGIMRKDIEEAVDNLLPDNAQFNGVAQFPSRPAALAYLEDIKVRAYEEAF